MHKNFGLIFIFTFSWSVHAVFNLESYDSSLNLSHADSQIKLFTPTNNLDGTVVLRNDSAGVFTANSLATDVINYNQGLLVTNSTTVGGGKSCLALNAVQIAADNSDKLILNGAVVATCTAQAPTRKVEIAAGTTVKIVGSPIFDQDLLFTDNAATLQLGISNRLNQNIKTSNSGNTNTLQLLQDLALEDGVLGFVPQGTALINLNGHRYEFGFLDSNNYNEGSTYQCLDMTYGTTNLQFSNPGNFGGISLRSNFRTKIGMRGFGRIYGNGNIFDFRTPAPGVFSFLDLIDGDIILENVHMVGLQLFKNTSAAARNIILMDNVTIEIAQYEGKQTGGAAINTTIQYGNLSTGTINLVVRGNNCKIITGESALEFANTTTGSNPCNIVIEDGKTLIYDTLGTPDACNVRVAGSGSITFGRGARLQHIASRSSVPADYSISIDTAKCTKYYLSQSKQLSGSTKISFINGTPGTPRAVIFDGASNSVKFSNIASIFFHLDSNVQLTLQNIVLEDFNPAAINYGAASSTLTFGDGVFIKLAKDFKIAATDRAWSFNGTSIIDGNDFTLTVSGDDMLALGGTSKTLTLKNLRLKLLGTESLSCSTPTAKIILDDSKVVVGADGWGFKTGNIDVQNEAQITGFSKTFYDFGSTALAQNNNHLTGSAAFLKAIRRLGFETNYVLAYNQLAGSGKICLQEATTYNSNAFRVASINNAQNLEYKTGPIAAATTVTGPFKALGMGMDNQIWLIKTDRTIYRLDMPTTLVAAPSLGDQISVGSTTHVFMADDSTGLVYKNANPTAGSPGSWTLIEGVYAPRSICAVSDGTLWFVDNKGRCLRRNGSNIELIHDGVGYNFQRVSASGDKDLNFVALLSSVANDGRVLVSKDLGPFFDLGISLATDVAIGFLGSLVCKFSNVVVPEHTTSGQPTLWRASTINQLPLLLDQSLTFSSAGSLAIKTLSTLEIANSANFRYQANPSADGTNTNATKRHLIMADMSAQLKLSNSSLTSTTTALALDYGRLSIFGNANIYSSAATANNFELGSAVDVRVYPNANMALYGPMIVQPTTVP